MVKIHGLSHGKHQKERVNVALINLRVTVSGRIAQILPLTEYLAVKFLCLLIAVEKAVLALTGHLTVYSLPLHLCELAPFLYLLFSWRSWNWLGQVLYTLCLPGAAAALVFPDWTVYPQWSLMNINSFLVHGLLILFPVLQLAAGTIRPRLSAIWKPLLFLAVVTPPIWLFNRTWGTNYFFLNTASPNSPLALLLEVTGPAWYLPAYALLAVAVMVVLLLPWHWRRE